MSIDITSANFASEVLETKGIPVLVDFWAPWCGPCQMQVPIVEELAKSIGPKAKVFKVNVDENPDLAGQYGIMSIPALKVFKDGDLVEEMTGVHSKPQLMEVISRHS
jgi:thioredoxin 1